MKFASAIMLSVENEDTKATPNWTLDKIAGGLTSLRREAGEISYAYIATQITHNRKSAGMPAKLAVVSRSTVYNAFQPGRARINARLVGEIVSVLTNDPATAKEWQLRCVAAQRATNSNIPAQKSASIEESLAQPAANISVEPAVAISAEPTVLNSNSSNITPAVVGKTLTQRASHISRILALGFAINLIVFVTFHAPFPGTFPLFADMAGVAIVAILLGPWWGALTAVLSTAAITAIYPLTSTGSGAIYFAPVAVVGALVWGYGIHRFRFGTSLPRFLTLNVLTGFACTATAYIVANIVFGGDPMMPSVAAMAGSLVHNGLPTGVAFLGANLIISVLDKMMIGIIALVITGTLLKKYAPAPVSALLSAPIEAARVKMLQIASRLLPSVGLYPESV